MKLNWLYIAWRNVGLKKLQTALSLVLLAFGVGLVSLLMLSEKQLSDTFYRQVLFCLLKMWIRDKVNQHF